MSHKEFYEAFKGYFDHLKRRVKLLMPELKVKNKASKIKAHEDLVKKLKKKHK